MTPSPASVPTTASVPTIEPTTSARPKSTSSPNPEPTVRPIPTSTHTPIPTSTFTPIQEPDDRHGVIVHTGDPVVQQWFLDFLGTEWFLDWSDRVDIIPSGHQKVIYIIDLQRLTLSEIQAKAQQAPGSVWYIVAEPNRRAGYGASDIVGQLHDLYISIKQADSTAKITSPAVLNWDFTCVGCGGYQSGHSWVDDFRSEYLARYQEEPPVDIWAIDIYPIDWHNLPTVNPQIPIDQIIEMRKYLDNIPSQQGKPIWITEFGLHWGWDGMDFDVEGCNSPTPAGEYQTELVIEYLRTVFDWLETNSDSQNIERWFTVITYHDITTCNSAAYAGLTLFDGPDIGAGLTPVGQFFMNRVKSGAQ
jgi:hypothetical protein